MSLSFRVIAKLLFLMVIIGFCMPIACDQNGFKIASGDGVSSELKMSLYALFITAIIGFLIGVILLMNKSIPVIIDWLVVIACALCGTIPFFKNLSDYGDSYQSGVYIIMIGLGLIVLFQFISAVRRER
jgi:L-asparagine transporter-like permease